MALAQQSRTSPALAEFEDINTALMRSTFRIEGPSTLPGVTSVGTIFILGRPLKADSTKLAYVLVTATHVLTDIKGSTALLSLRKKNPDGTFAVGKFPIQIRDPQNQELFFHHKTADVAVMYIALPNEADLRLIPADIIADDKKIETLEIHPGDELLCLGYPFGLSVNDWGFPILRSGIISSYPLTPAAAVKYIGFDFRIYGGNSGGPVYFKYTGRTYGGVAHLTETVSGIIGLVSQQVSASDGTSNTPISLAHIVPGQFIKEAIDLLPEPKP